MIQQQLCVCVYVCTHMCTHRKVFKDLVINEQKLKKMHHVRCYDHTQLELTEWVEHKNCVVSDMRWWVKRWLNHKNVKLTFSRLSWPFEAQPLFYIERIVSLMKMIVFNSIQVINYWFTLHCTLRFLYQQA